MHVAGVAVAGCKRGTRQRPASARPGAAGAEWASRLVPPHPGGLARSPAPLRGVAEPRGNGVPGFLIHASRFRCCLAEDSCNDTSECADEESGFLVGAACPPAAAHAPLPAGPPGPLRQKGARRGRLPGSQHQSASIAPRGSTPVVSSPLHAALRPPGDPSPSGLSTSDHPSSSTPTPGSPSSWV